MIQYVLIGILGFLVTVLAVKLSQEKSKSEERDNILRKMLTESDESLRKEQMQLSDAMNKSLDDGLNKMNRSINSVKDEVNRKLESTNKAINASVEENKRLVARSNADNNTRIEQLVTSIEKLREETVENIRLTDESLQALIEDNEELIEESNAQHDRSIELLTTVVEQISRENAELRKKLEFFAEIEEDSQNINETDDAEEREKLIRQALSELSLKPAIENKSASRKSEGTGQRTVEKKAASKKTKGIGKSKVTEKTISEETDITGNTAVEEKSVPKKPEKTEKSVATEKPSSRNFEIAEESTVETTDVSDSKPTLAGGILDDEQRIAFKIMNDTNENLFITGKAGTGKSFLLEMFVRGTDKKVIVLAPTGIAALNVGGSTLHATFGYNNLENLDIDQINLRSIVLKGEKREVLRRVDTIVIDEISMVRADIFDKIDKILRVLNKNAKPFGGKQVIVFGDLFQLPPIAQRQVEKYLTDYYGGIFFFNSNSYSNGNFGFIELTINHRQKDDKEFFGILNRMREGEFTRTDLNRLNERYINDRSELRRILTLFPRKADAEKVNKEELDRIDAREYIYRAKIVYAANKNKTTNLESNFPITEELHLKRGALVMMVANDPNKRWVNGTIGIVHSLYDDAVKVTIDGTTYDVPQMTFTQREASYVNGRIEYSDVLSVEQFPVVLAYAITIHKSQGMTYKRIACDISQCFAPGQAYVALSRCSSMGGLYLMEEVTGDMIRTNKQVVDFYKSQSTEETVLRFS